MIDGIVDNLKVISSMAFKDHYMPKFDEDGSLIQSEEQASQYVKRFKKLVKEGKILRFWMHNQISSLDCYKEFDDFINQKRKEEVDRLNEEYYGKEQYIRIKQCM